MKDYFKKDIPMKGIPLPRVRGNAYELPNKRWAYEFELRIGQDKPMVMGTRDDFEGYETKEEAVKALKDCAQVVLRETCLALGIDQAGWLDLNKNEIVQEL